MRHNVCMHACMQHKGPPPEEGMCVVCTYAHATMLGPKCEHTRAVMMSCEHRQAMPLAWQRPCSVHPNPHPRAVLPGCPGRPVARASHWENRCSSWRKKRDRQACFLLVKAGIAIRPPFRCSRCGFCPFITPLYLLASASPAAAPRAGAGPCSSATAQPPNAGRPYVYVYALASAEPPGPACQPCCLGALAPAGPHGPAPWVQDTCDKFV